MKLVNEFEYRPDFMNEFLQSTISQSWNEFH